jgi:cysteine desulfurase
MDKPRLYFDHNATSPLDPEVRTELLLFLGHALGNPSSQHSFGREVRVAVARARGQVARLIGAGPDEIVFTSGGTEANNAALFGAVPPDGAPSAGVAVSAIEHPSVLNPARRLERLGHPVRLLPVTPDGALDLARLDAALPPSVRLVSVMLANNETGAVQPAAEAARAAHARGALFHTDAVQAAGKIPVDVAALGADLLSLSAHKLHGPPGVGALYVKRGTALEPLLYGGGQERGLRPCTENAAAIVGFGKACELAAQRLAEDARRIAERRALFEALLLAHLPGAAVNADGAPRLPNTANIRFPGLDAGALIRSLDALGLAVSGGSACSSHERTPSHVLLAMGQSPEQAGAAVRFSIGRETDDGDIEQAVRIIASAAGQMKPNDGGSRREKK